MRPSATTATSSGSGDAGAEDQASEAGSLTASSDTSEDILAGEEEDATDPADVPKPDYDLKFIANSRTKALHVAGGAEGEAACGYVFAAAAYECFSTLPDSGRWHLCRRPNCFKEGSGKM